MRRAAAALILLLLVAGEAAALEQSARVEGLRLRRTEGALLCDLDLAALFPPAVESTLRSGLPVIIDVALELEGAPGGTLGRLLRSEVSYDVWEDRYTLRRDASASNFADLPALSRACHRVRDLALTPWPALAGASTLRLRARVAVNPLGNAERRRMARWLARTVSDAGDPSSRELRLDLGALIGSFFGGEEDAGWGPERRFGPFSVAELPLAGPGTEETP